MVLRKLAISSFVHRRVRVVLTCAAIALSVSLVVAVTSGYASVEAAAYRFLSQYMGSVDAQLTRQDDPQGGVPESLAAEIAEDPAVRGVTTRLELESGLLDAEGVPVPGRAAQVVGIRRPDDVQVETQQMVEGDWFDAAEGNVAVVDQVAAERLGVGVGGEFFLPSVNGRLTLRVVGIVHKPGILAQHLQTIYVPLETLQQFALADEPDQLSRVMIDLRGDADDEAFAARWTEELAARDPMFRLRLASDIRQELDKNLMGLEVVSYLGGAISMLAATFIVFSSLSMGVTERQRTLAMLRAIGMERRQVAGLVIVEGLMLAGIGILIGVPLGWLWVNLLRVFPQFESVLTAGVVLSAGGVALGAGGSLLAALLASILPAWQATRVDPLEAMTPLAAPPSRSAPFVSAVAGLLLIAIDPILMFSPSALWLGLPEEWERAARFYGHFVLGIPALMIGFFLLAPLFVWLAERVVGPVVAAMLAIRPALLRQQLTSGLWRAAGTCAALMVGLAILVVMQTQGRSALSSWQLPDKFPDVFIAASPFSGLGVEQQEKLEDVTGIREVMPIAIASPRFGGSMFALIGAAMMPDATMFFGVDPDKAFDMMELDFREGNAEQARALLKQGRHVIVTEEFRQLKGLGVGDTLPLRTSTAGIVDYTIAGVVWSPGMDLITSLYDMGRQFDQRTAGSLFGSIADARRDFGVEQVFLFAANLDYFVEKQDLIDNIARELGVMGMKVGDVRQIKADIQSGFGNLLLLVSTVALAAMAVASLGVTNTVMASIRTRRWQFGVLRSIGVTRGQLLRLVLAEAVLLGLVACALGLAAGFMMVFNARGLGRHVIGFVPPLDVPWGMVGIGAGAIMLIALLASIVPAVSVARAEPLTLLQAGRASA